MNLKINAIALFALTACGGGYNPDRAALERLNQKVSSTRFEILGSPESLNYEASENRVLGSGDLRMAPDLGESESAHSFVFEFVLTRINSELTFVSHADTKLQNGVELRFRRTDAASSPFVAVKASGEVADWSNFFASLDAAKTFKLAVDVHNDHGPFSHLIVWDEKRSGAKLLDSGADTDGAPGHGFGAHWGFRLRDAHLISVSRGEPRDAH
ncbi:MAG TPA: hypothetical protein VM901_03230 [Bdellovibrionota bacterium]|jgi:hypothetical protein|nr:hypothetical protein [Bdellovibrionota bacterium]